MALRLTRLSRSIDATLTPNLVPPCTTTWPATSTARVRSALRVQAHLLDVVGVRGVDDVLGDAQLLERRVHVLLLGLVVLAEVLRAVSCEL